MARFVPTKSKHKRFPPPRPPIRIPNFEYFFRTTQNTQVYQILLDSRFQPPADQSITGDGGSGGVNVTLDIQWQFALVRSDRQAAAAVTSITTPDACGWRVSRCREGEAEFPVKEGVGAERGLEKSAGGVVATKRDGYR